MSIEREISELINQMARAVQHKRLHPGDDTLTLANIRLLTYLYSRVEPPSINDIAQLLDTSLPGASVMVDKLELDGLVARERDKADGRIVRIVLSQKGIDKFSSHVEQSTEMLKIVLQDFSERDKGVVMRFITSYVRLVESSSSCH